MPLTMLDKNATINVTGINISMKMFLYFRISLLVIGRDFVQCAANIVDVKVFAVFARNQMNTDVLILY